MPQLLPNKNPDSINRFNIRTNSRKENSMLCAESKTQSRDSTKSQNCCTISRYAQLKRRTAISQVKETIKMWDVAPKYLPKFI